MRLIPAVCLFFALLFTQCSKTVDPVPAAARGDLEISLFHRVDQFALQLNKLYRNAAGYDYSISRLQYYLSGFRLSASNGNVYTIDTFIYADAYSPHAFVLKQIPAGQWSAISFYIGLDPVHNQSGYLPPELNNVNMAWPDPMGGGYHFLKLEGYYKLPASAGTEGYAVHLGTGGSLVSHNNIPCQLDINAQKACSLALDMNVNEWLTGPVDYDFVKHGNYTMGDLQLMKIISDNGKDVFSLH